MLYVTKYWELSSSTYCPRGRRAPTSLFQGAEPVGQLHLFTGSVGAVALVPVANCLEVLHPRSGNEKTATFKTPRSRHQANEKITTIRQTRTSPRLGQYSR